MSNMVSESCQVDINQEMRVIYPKPYASSAMKSSKSTGMLSKMIKFTTLRNLPKGKPKYLEVRKSLIEIEPTHKELSSLGRTSKNLKQEPIKSARINQKIHSNTISGKIIPPGKLGPLMILPHQYGKSIGDLEWISQYAFIDVKKLLNKRVYQ